ncbi:putative integral membrane protein [Brugia pahangi]
MRILGLTSYTENPAWRYPLMIYNIMIMIIMNGYSAFIITEIEFTGFNVNIAFAIVHACYLASGGICSLFLFWMRKSFNRLIKIVVQQVAIHDPNFKHALRLHRMCKIMVGLTIFWAMIAVITTAVCFDAFIDDMHHDGIVIDHNWTSSQAVNHVLKYKHRYRGLKKTADIIEEQFKYAIAYVDALCFTELCFILYTYLEDRSESKTWIDTILCILYAISSLFHMTFFTAPAYRLYERVIV